MNTLKSRLERLETVLQFKSPEPTPKYTDEELAAMAEIFREIHGYERVYKNNSWREVWLTPEGLIVFHTGEAFDETTGTLFDSLESARLKRPGIQIVSASAELAERLLVLLKGEGGSV